MENMGCDIHPHIEYKHSGSTAYEWFASPDSGQSYLLFALLADVRKRWVKEHMGLEVSAMYAPRGIPADTSYKTSRGHDGCEYWSDRTQAWELDTEFHSGSWLKTDELQAVIETYFGILGNSIEEYRAQYGIDQCVELRATLKAMEVLPNARLVFWFDN